MSSILNGRGVERQPSDQWDADIRAKCSKDNVNGGPLWLWWCPWHNEEIKDPVWAEQVRPVMDGRIKGRQRQIERYVHNYLEECGREGENQLINR